MARRSYPDALKAEVLELYPTLGAAECARRFDIPKPTVTVWAHRAGVKSNAAEITEAATSALVATFADRRARLADRLLALAETAAGREAELLATAKLYEVVGCRTRSIHDYQLLSGQATQRSEVRTVDAIDAEIQALTAAMVE
jgi:transposase-like protein